MTLTTEVETLKREQAYLTRYLIAMMVIVGLLLWSLAYQERKNVAALGAAKLENEQLVTELSRAREPIRDVDATCTAWLYNATLTYAKSRICGKQK